MRDESLRGRQQGAPGRGLCVARDDGQSTGQQGLGTLALVLLEAQDRGGGGGAKDGDGIGVDRG